MLGIIPIENDVHNSAVREFYVELFNRIGVNVTIKTFPQARLHQQLEDGLIDAVFARADSGVKSGNIVVVRESIFEDAVNIFSQKSEYSFSNLKSLIGYKDSLNVGCVNGVVSLRDVLNDLKKVHNVIGVTEELQGLKMLVAGRIDVFIASGYKTKLLLDRSDFSMSGIKSSGVAVHSRLYINLHSKHMDLVGPLEKALRDMKANGEYGRLLQVLNSHYE
ncbi:MAG: substrate-binding periplasmic protein [Halodesulfovibrio sp.]